MKEKLEPGDLEIQLPRALLYLGAPKLGFGGYGEQAAYMVIDPIVMYITHYARAPAGNSTVFYAK